MVFEKPWRTRIPQRGQDLCLRDAFKCENPALISLVLEEGKISAYEAKRHLHESIYKIKDASIVRMLLDTGAEPDELELKAAASVGNEEIVDILIQNGVNTFSQPIIIAAKKGNIEALKKLLAAGGNPRTRNSCPINYTAERGMYEVVEVLIQYGEHPSNVRPNVIDKIKRLAKMPGYSNSKFRKTLEVLEKAGLNAE